MGSGKRTEVRNELGMSHDSLGCTATIRVQWATRLSDKEGRVREMANKRPKINGRVVSNDLTLCVDALCQAPHVTILYRRSHRC